MTLLGQNVNSYRWKEGTAEAVDFPALVERVAGISPLLRVRFATSHPKDLSDRLIEVMASYPNICRAVHLPAQSGSDRMLAAMNRKYTRAWYLERVAAIRRRMPDCAVTTDLIAGFCGETAEDHAQTLSLMREVGYDSAYMFKYSQRPGTLASRTMADDVSEEVKTARLNEIIALQNELSAASNERDMGNVFEVLVEGSRGAAASSCAVARRRTRWSFSTGRGDGSGRLRAGSDYRMHVGDTVRSGGVRRLSLPVGRWIQ